MLHELLVPLSDEIIVFNLVRYLTFRTGMAILTALAIGLLMGPAVIGWLQRRQGRGQPIRDDGPVSHQSKAGTPTMGGVIILVSVLASTLLWADLTNGFVLVVLLVTAGFGLIGFGDDYLKLTRRDSKGLPGRLKLAGQIGAGFAAMLLIVTLTRDELATGMALPFFKDVLVELGWFYVVFGIVVMVAAANSVNLTDGLDGLAIVPIMLAALAFATICYLAGNAIYADYLRIFHVPGTGELAIFCGALIGAAMAFLWYNAPPAQVFMGDTGSQASGGALGTMAVITKHELVLPIIGGLFVLEAGSVILQVASVRLAGARLFRMAPLHHHFEQKGWPETTVVIRFWIIAAVLALIGLSTLKLR